MRPERAAGIEVRDAPDGVVVYDARRDRLHYLNPTAALLLECCDGTVRVTELPGLLAMAFALPDPPTADVHECLLKLLDEGLLVV